VPSTDLLTGALRALAGPPGRGLARLGVSPNGVTLTALALNVAGAAAIAGGALGRIGAGLLILGAGFLDAIDGAVARAAGRETAFGAVLDAFVDRVAEGALLLGLLVAAEARGDRAAALLSAAALATFPLVSYVRAKAEAHRLRVTSGLANRSWRVLLLGAGVLVDAYAPVVAFLAATSLATAVHRLLVVRRLLAARSPGA
jgi:CDP-diacylglycerol--glycerol-3-phosphate 3-phosphatidyltransferase